MKTLFKDVWNAIIKDSGVINRLLLILLVLAILVIAMLLSGPKPKDYTPTATPTPPPAGWITSSISPADAPSPEYVQATGVIIAVIMVVLIIIIGTIVELIRSKDKDRT